MIHSILHLSIEEATREAVLELSARYGDAVPASIIDDVLSDTSVHLLKPRRNADGSVSVRDYADWHYAIGEAMTRELDIIEQEQAVVDNRKTAYADFTK